MRHSVGRLVTRMQGDDDGLMIGSCFSQDYFEPNTTYEIQKCMLTGDLVLKKCGESCVGSGITGLNWAFEQQLLLTRLEAYFFLTKQEYIKLLRDGEQNA